MAGDLVDVQSWPTFEDRAWVTSQLKLAERWRNLVRQRIEGGGYALTAARRKLLGIEDDGAMLAEDTDAERAWHELDAQLARLAP